MTTKSTQIAPPPQFNFVKQLLLLACLLFVSPVTAQAGELLFAYIDPFTGSLVLQVLAGAFMGIMIFFKKIKAFAFGLFRIKNNVESIDDMGDVPSIQLNTNMTNDYEQQTKAA